MSWKTKLTKIANWFQPAYDKINRWDLSPEVQQLFDGLWGVLTPQIQAYLWKLLREMYADYGPDRAKTFLEETLKSLKKILKV